MGGPAFFKKSMRFVRPWWHWCASLPSKMVTFFWNLQTSNLKRILFSPEAARSSRAAPRSPRKHAFYLGNQHMLLSHIHIITFQPRPRQILRIWYPYRTFCFHTEVNPKHQFCDLAKILKVLDGRSCIFQKKYAFRASVVTSMCVPPIENAHFFLKSSDLPSKMLTFQPRSAQITPDQARSLQIRPDLARSAQIRPDQARSA